MKRQGAQEGLLVIDEAQKIENWSEYVKREWDADTRNALALKVIVLGSSRLLLQKGLSESLAGRFEATYLGHWSLNEMQAAFGFDAERYAWFGGYPGAAALVADEARWKNYVTAALVEASISKDILMLTQVNKPALMKRLFDLGCQFSGQILSFSKIMGQWQDAGNTTTLAHYLDLLHQAGLLSGLPKFSPNTLRQRAASPKFQVHNPAFLSAQQPRPRTQVQADPAEWGRWVESAVGAHLLNEALCHNLELYYWRDRNQEVDFVLGYRNQYIGLEVKSGPSNAQTSGMQAFQARFYPHKCLRIGPGGLPWEEFLRMEVRELF